MLADIAKILGLAKPHPLGDPVCTGFDAKGVPNFADNPTAGCSGIEGLIIPGLGAVGPAAYGDAPGACVYGTGANCDGDFSLDARADLNPSNNWDSAVGWYLPVIKPSDLSGALCIDPQTQTDCDVTVFPQNLTSLWQNTLNHVIRVLGRGNVHSLPEELQDVRYYFKWYGIAFAKYLKAYANFKVAHPGNENNVPDGTAAGGLGPSNLVTQPIDQEEMFFDYLFQTGIGAGQIFDKFEYVDRDYIGQGAGGSDCTGGFAESNCVPWDFEYGTDLLGGNQRYDNWFRRMDREEIALYSAMLEDKTHTPGQENNVNVTNLAGSGILAANWSTWQCATGQYSDPTVKGGNECGGVNPPLDPAYATATCAAGQLPVNGKTWEAGVLPFCGVACNYTANAATGCADPSMACVFDGTNAACVHMKMDRNGAYPCTAADGVTPVACPAPSTVAPHPLLWRYPSAWGHSPFGLGHSPITLAQADKQSGIGVAKITIPNFAAGPYTTSPIAPTVDPTTMKATCPMGYSLSSNQVWCNAALNTGSGTSAASFTPLTPWLEVGGGETVNGGPVGFSIPEDGQRDQFLTTGQLDFTGVLESYVVDYVPWRDPVQPSCVSSGKCSPGYNCNPNSQLCETDDNTIRIEAIEGQDFLGQVFVCSDQFSSDVLHVGMYDSAASFLTWLANHPGGINPNLGQVPSAQIGCSIIIRTSPYDNAVDHIASLTAGVDLNFSGGAGQGRVTDVVVFDPNLIQNF
jgi:hypothetical protein